MDGPFVAGEGSLFNLGKGHQTSQLLERRVPDNTMHKEQEAVPGSASEQFANTINVDEAATRIGSVLNNGKFMCDDKGCADLTFGRQAELRRHYATFHAINKPNFWCQVSFCQRSKKGGVPFHRKDKLISHIRSVHGNV
jgi:hypothetical protein